VVLRAFAICLALSLAGSAGAGSLETLVMPGPVAAAHADVETRCGRCHVAFEQAAQRGLCLDCHEDVAADQQARQRFHGLHPAASSADCRTCHAEHRGRGADLLGLDREAFAHGHTAFPLEGGHVGVACAACHAAGRRFREAPSACADCHGGADDPHRGGLGSDCAGCHEVGGWRGARFDHGATRFPLAGRHAEAPCALCHPGERYQDTPQDCAGCHRLDDVHQGRFGAACGDCHQPDGWAEADFDHARDTRFALRGRHAEAACAACHGEGPPRALPADCLSCHRPDDVHEGRHGARCGDCHGESAWKPARFDHARTRFALRGAHTQVSCEACHTAGIDAPLETACVGCHRQDDAHEGQQGTSCERCHDAGGWRDRVRFDHDLTRFPLLGMHAAAACEECHASAAYQDAAEACVDCHRADDGHEARLGSDCARCHNPNAWTAWRFDHARETSYPLAGAHAELRCESCHVQPARAGALAPLASACSTCHAADDPHRGELGRDCARCHGDASWREVSIQR
jgi:hypothetical protein